MSRILVADDDAAIRKVVLDSLEKAGHDVETAIDCVKSGFDDKEINAVLLVDMSPGYDPFVDAPGLLPKIRGQCSVPAPCKFVHVFTIGPAGDKGMAAIATNGRGVPYTLGGSAHFLSHVVAAF